MILVRHAEKDTAGDPKDPGLSEAGRGRARALARLLSRSRASHLFASELKRTQETLAPLAEELGVEIEILPAGKAQDLAARLAALPAGSVSVVAGHSNTVPALIAALGGEARGLETTPQGPVIPDRDHGRLYVLTLPPAAPGAPAGRKSALLELRYGDGD